MKISLAVAALIGATNAETIEFGKEQYVDMLSGVAEANGIKVNPAALLDCIKFEDNALIAAILGFRGPVTDLIDDLKSGDWSDVGVDAFLSVMFEGMAVLVGLQGAPACAQAFDSTPNDIQTFFDARKLSWDSEGAYYNGNSITGHAVEAQKAIADGDFKQVGQIWGSVLKMFTREQAEKPDYTPIVEAVMGYLEGLGYKVGDIIPLLLCIDQADDAALEALTMADMAKEIYEDPSLKDKVLGTLLFLFFADGLVHDIEQKVIPACTGVLGDNDDFTAVRTANQVLLSSPALMEMPLGASQDAGNYEFGQMLAAQALQAQLEFII